MTLARFVLLCVAGGLAYLAAMIVFVMVSIHHPFAGLAFAGLAVVAVVIFVVVAERGRA